MIGDIVRVQLEGLSRRMLDRGLMLEVTDAAVDSLAEAGWDPQFGARPLKRVIQKELENAIATRVLSDEIKAGDRVLVDVDSGVFSFTVSAVATREDPVEA